jgi:hypothetical protein
VLFYLFQAATAGILILASTAACPGSCTVVVLVVVFATKIEHGAARGGRHDRAVLPDAPSTGTTLGSAPRCISSRTLPAAV